jgi:hypothetical protein
MRIIFPNEVSQNVTNEFSLSGRGVLIQSKGMVQGQELLLEYFFGDECDGSWEPVIWCCGQAKLSAPVNQMLIPAFPGRYRMIAITLDESENLVPFDQIDWEDVEVQMIKLDISLDTSDFIQSCC